jgi:DNA-binding transcriptional LysR family regulator
MDWTNITFDWNRIRAFLVTAEEGSLSAAARALGTTQPTLGRQVAAIEEELGVTLFERVGRGLELTEAGLALLDDVRTMGEAAGRVSRLAAGQAQEITGQVSISASEVVSAYLLPPILTDLRHLHPGINLEIVASNATADLKRREADIAIRNHRPTDDGLIARRLPDRMVRLYATPDYLAGLSEQQTLGDAVLIGFDTGPALIGALNQAGLSLSQDSVQITSTNQLVQWQMARQGAGIGLMLQEVGDADPTMERALPDMAPIPVPMWLTAHRELATSLRIRSVFDFLAERLK